jgi:hypothetical protein
VIYNFVTCPRCGGCVPLIDNKLPVHYIGDVPYWFKQELCQLSNKPQFRRKPIKKQWFEKYFKK